MGKTVFIMLGILAVVLAIALKLGAVVARNPASLVCPQSFSVQSPSTGEVQLWKCFADGMACECSAK